MDKQARRELGLSTLLLGLVFGIGTNLVTGSADRWWPPLQPVARYAVVWLPLLVLAVICWDVVTRRRRSKRLWRNRESPYPGLEAFAADRTAVFFGREDETRQLVDRVKRAGDAPARRFVPVVGPSGCGKSSLLQLVLAAPIIYLGGAVIFSPLRAILRDVPSNWFTNLLSVLAFVIWVAAFVTLGNRNYADALIARERAAQRVMQRFHQRWLGLWAPEDEAIAGLKWLAPDHGDYDYEWLCTPPRRRPDYQAPKKPDFPFADKFRPLKVPVTDAYLIPHVLILAHGRITKPAILAFNKFAAPAVGRGVVRIIRTKAQGANLPHAPLVYASAWPLPLEPACPGLPHDVIEKIQSGASRDAGQLGTLARKLFMIATLEGLPEAREIYREIYEGSSLVHTSYFNHEAVLRLIVLHIARTSGASTAASSDLSKWLTANAAALQARIDKFIADRLR